MTQLEVEQAMVRIHDELKELIKYINNRQLGTPAESDLGTVPPMPAGSLAPLLVLLNGLQFWEGWREGTPIDIDRLLRELDGCDQLTRSLLGQTSNRCTLRGHLMVAEGLLHIVRVSATELSKPLPPECREVTLSRLTREQRNYLYPIRGD